MLDPAADNAKDCAATPSVRGGVAPTTILNMYLHNTDPESWLTAVCRVRTLYRIEATQKEALPFLTSIVTLQLWIAPPLTRLLVRSKK